MLNYARDLALVESYIELTKSISKQIQEYLKRSGTTQSHFQDKLQMQRLTFFRRLTGKIKWEPQELLIMIKALEKADKVDLSRLTSRVESYMNLAKEIPAEIQKHAELSKVKKSYFHEQLSMKRLAFFRRLTGEINWSPQELILLIKALEKAEKIK